jgi:hypothetical protein
MDCRPEHLYGNTPKDNIPEQLFPWTAQGTTFAALLLGCGDLRNALNIVSGDRAPKDASNILIDLVDQSAVILARNFVILTKLNLAAFQSSSVREETFQDLWQWWYDAIITLEAAKSLQQLLIHLLDAGIDDPFFCKLVPNQNDRGELYKVVKNFAIVARLTDSGMAAEGQRVRLKRLNELCNIMVRNVGPNKAYEDWAGRMAAQVVFPLDVPEPTILKECTEYAKYGYVHAMGSPELRSSPVHTHINSMFFRAREVCQDAASPELTYNGDHHLIPCLGYVPFAEEGKSELVRRMGEKHGTPLTMTCYSIFREWCYGYCNLLVRSGGHCPFRFFLGDAVSLCSSKLRKNSFPSGYSLVLTSNLADKVYVGWGNLFAALVPLLDRNSSRPAIVHTSNLTFDDDIDMCDRRFMPEKFPKWQEVVHKALPFASELGLYPHGFSRDPHHVRANSLHAYHTRVVWINACNLVCNGGCGTLKTAAAPLKRCTQCRKAFYCGQICQNNAWHEHKKHCSKPKT